MVIMICRLSFIRWRFAGLPENPESFCDILEVIPTELDSELQFNFCGNTVNCEPEKNLVVRAAKSILSGRTLNCGCEIYLDKHIPDGAGLGGGSADASFTLKSLNKLLPEPLSKEALAELALELGADCPFFIYNSPMFASGVGEKLEDIPLDLTGYWIVIAKPDVYISTREAFAGVDPKESDFDLRTLPDIPVESWQGIVKNDFEDSIFPHHGELRELKEEMLRLGALYSSMSGSGSSIYGIFRNYDLANNAKSSLRSYPTIEGVYLLKL